MIRSLSFRACALAAVVCAALIALLGALAISTQQTREAFGWVDHTQRVLGVLDQTTTSLLAAESGQRGYVLTRNPLFAEAFEAKLHTSNVAIEDLIALTPDNPVQHARALELRTLQHQRTGMLKANYELALRGRFSEAQASIASGRGRSLMIAVADLAGKMREDERRLMDQRAASFDRLVSGTRTTLVIGGLLLLAMLAGFVALTIHQVRRPTRVILDAMGRLAAGDDDAQIDEKQGSTEFSALARAYNKMAGRLRENAQGRRDAEVSLQSTNIELAASAADAAQRGAAIERLAGMAHRMQAARTDEEMALVIGCFVPQVLPGTSGLLYAFNNSRNQLSLVAGWGGHSSEVIGFAPEDCWALRRGQSHAVAMAGADVICRHVEDNGIPYHCEPLLAGGDVIGLLQLDGGIAAEDHFMLNALAENIASALVNHRLQRGLREQTIRDPLTALYNRRYMEETLTNEIARAGRGIGPLTLVMCDVDHFKRFNDEFGHSGGDAVLQAVGAEMNRHFRDGDIVCRYGGEEFAIIAPGADTAAIAQRVEQLREAIGRMMVRDGNRPLGTVNMSFGVAEWEDGLGIDPAILIQRADAALYRAKREGRNRTVVEARIAA